MTGRGETTAPVMGRVGIQENATGRPGTTTTTMGRVGTPKNATGGAEILTNTTGGLETPTRMTGGLEMPMPTTGLGPLPVSVTNYPPCFDFFQLIFLDDSSASIAWINPGNVFDFSHDLIYNPC